MKKLRKRRLDSDYDLFCDADDVPLDSDAIGKLNLFLIFQLKILVFSAEKEEARIDTLTLFNVSPYIPLAQNQDISMGKLNFLLSFFVVIQIIIIFRRKRKRTSSFKSNDE